MADDLENKEKEKAAQPVSNGWQIINFDAFKNPPGWLAASVYVLAGLLALAVLFLVAVGLFATFQIAYESVVGDLKDRVEAAKVFFPILLALVGGPLLIWRVVTAHVQAEAARHQANIAQDGLYTSLFTKAVEQLGATREVKTYREISGGKKRESVTATEPNIEVRLGAIYALERIARNSEQDYWAIMEVLCAYLRNPQNSGAPLIAPEEALGELNGEAGNADLDTSNLFNWSVSLPAPRIDVQAAVDVIGRRSTTFSAREQGLGFTLDFTGANLQSIKFDKGNFENARFHKSQLGGASFDAANLAHAEFIDANASFTKFDGSKMQFAILQYVHLEHASFEKACLSNAKFEYVNGWFSNFEAADLNNAYITDSAFIAALFSRAKMSSAAIEYANFESAKFRSSQLDHAQLYAVQMEYAELLSACLAHTRLFDVRLSKTAFARADLQGLIAFEIDFSGAENLTTEQLNQVLGDASTKIRKGMKRPAAWPDRELSGEEQDVWIKKADAATANRS